MNLEVEFVKVYCVQHWTILHIYVKTVFLFILLRNNSFNITNYHMKLLFLHVVVYICENFYFFMF